VQDQSLEHGDRSCLSQCPPRGPLHLWRACVAAMGMIGLASCGYDASLQRETPTGGLVTFSIQSEADVFSSDGRRDALRIMQEKCPSGVQIVKEGEVPKVSRAADRAWGPQIGTDRIWGIQFTCK
jgi:hypothetical protein